MHIGEEEANSLKMAIEGLKATPHGLFLLAFLQDRTGYYSPAYDPSNQTSIILAAGRGEFMMLLRNLERLTVEQIVVLCQEGQ